MLRRAESVLITVLLLSVLLTAGCTKERQGFAGEYLSEEDENGAPAVTLELGENGTGSWATDEDNVSFKWEVRGKEIWLHTRSGGVITGKITGDAIEIRLPGGDVHHFARQ
jgi:hypothetical protein